MPLPENPKQEWPPKQWEKPYQRFAEHAAWYSGLTEDLASVYASPTESNTGGKKAKFWSRKGQTSEQKNRQQLHVPLAGDIATVSADLLFSEIPNITVDDEPTQERLDELVERSGLHNLFLEGGEIAAALGGVYLRPVWDKGVADHPMLTAVHPDAAIPTFRWGVLTEVTFWRVVKEDAVAGKVWRHLEHHEKGVIHHALYEGTPDTIGSPVPLQDVPETADLADIVVDGTAVPTGLDTLDTRYVPNMRPYRRDRKSPLGRSDYDAQEGLMDALDEIYTSWMRDIRLGQARLMVSDQVVDRQGRGKGASFDIDQEAFVNPIDVDPKDGRLAIEKVQFDIRFEAHQKSALEMIDRIVSACGYSPQSFGLQIEGRAESGTALRLRQAKSFTTQAKKQRFWKPALVDVLLNMLQLDNTVFGRNNKIERPNLEWADTVAPDPKELAETVELMKRAQSASIETRVRMFNPDWDDDQVNDEVKRIQDEEGLKVPVPVAPPLTGGDPMLEGQP